MDGGVGGNSGGVTLGRVIGVEVEGGSTFRGVDGSPPEGLTVPKEGVLRYQGTPSDRSAFNSL